MGTAAGGRKRMAGRYHRHCEPTGRANARPMTGSAKQSIAPRKKMDCFVALLLAMTAKARGSPEQRSALRLQPFRGPGCEVGEDAVGAGALESQQAFHHRPLAVDP